MIDHLRRAMAAVDDEESGVWRPSLERVATEIGEAAVQTALIVHEPDRDGAEARKAEAAAARKAAETEEQRQRDLDAALADVVEMVARHRARIGRKTCSQHDGATIRKIFDLLRGLTPGVEE